MTKRTFTEGFVIETNQGFVSSGKTFSKLLGGALFFKKSSRALQKWERNHPNMEYKLVPARQSNVKHVSLLKGSQ